jgi:hypothetical protein
MRPYLIVGPLWRQVPTTTTTTTDWAWCYLWLDSQGRVSAIEWCR